jgi:NAD(P)-dependent dehydrogenase (short-subunit alcohol dehydrogenase family)
MILLDNKVVIIAGGLGRIGQNFADAVIENGGIAIIADISEERFQKFQLDKWNSTNQIEFQLIDVTSKESINTVIKNINQKFGKIDAFVNTSYPDYALQGRLLEDVTYELFCESHNLHLGSYFLCAQEFTTYFKTQGFGNIINISSIQGVINPKFDTYDGISVNGNPMTSELSYTCNKTALIAMTSYMAKYYKGSNIRFNCISPGGILDGQPEEFLEKYNAKCVSKGMLDGEDLKSTLIFLLSDGSKFYNGQNVVVDDGYTL